MNGSDVLIPAASVVVLRSAGQKTGSGIEVLMLKRSENLSYLGGAWVFPGGHVDAKDCGVGSLPGSPHDFPHDSIDAAYRAAVRETKEECGLTVSMEHLIPVALWITPSGLPKRFSTYFFMIDTVETDIEVDGKEIESHLWISPGDAISAHRDGRMFFAPPNFVTLSRISEYRDVDTVLSDHRDNGVKVYRPRLAACSGEMFSLYEEDEDYEKNRIETKGIRHRLLMKKSGWVYEKIF